MLDANGRPVVIGDWIATPYDAGDLLKLADVIGAAILGRAVEFDGEGALRLDTGDECDVEDIVTLGGLEWVDCRECGFSWPFDARMNDVEECPDCEAPFRVSQAESTLKISLTPWTP